MDAALLNKRASMGMQTINKEFLLYIFDHTEEFKDEFETNVRPKLTELKREYLHFSLVRAFSFIMPFSLKIAKYIQDTFEKRGVYLPPVSDVDLDEFSKELLRRYMEKVT